VHNAEERLKCLMLSGLAGDTLAYGRFFDEVSTHLKKYLRKRIPHLRDELDDLLQDILIAIHTCRHTFRTEDILTAWIFAIARYKLRDMYKSRACREAMHDPLEDHPDIPTLSGLERTEARWEVERLLAQLPENQRLSIVHVKLHGLTVAETALITGLSESTIKVGVHRGVKAMAAKLLTAVTVPP
jgi:RNA polymerase sigma-70 factor (ECF subfamily)